MCQHVIHVASGTQTRVVKCSNCREATVGGGEGGVALYPGSFPRVEGEMSLGTRWGGGGGVGLGEVPPKIVLLS